MSDLRMLKPELDRRAVLKLAGVASLGCFVTPGLRADDSVDRASEACKRGRQFLRDLFDSSLNLLPEYRGANVYWLYHDNYLAAKVLDFSDAELAEKIRAAIKSHGVERSGKIEIALGDPHEPLPFRHYELIEVIRTGDKVIKTEIVKTEPLEGWEKYADLLFLAAMAEKDAAIARKWLEAGLAMWDGTGFRDAVVDVARQYATYKLALSLLACRKLDVTPESKPAILDRLLAQQASSGGWITDYSQSGKPRGLANVETTSLTILALE